MCWHKWAKWTTVAEKELKRVIFNPFIPDQKTTREDIIGRLCEQERVCEKCGMKQLRIEKATI